MECGPITSRQSCFPMIVCMVTDKSKPLFIKSADELPDGTKHILHTGANEKEFRLIEKALSILFDGCYINRTLGHKVMKIDFWDYAKQVGNIIGVHIAIHNINAIYTFWLSNFSVDKCINILNSSEPPEKVEDKKS